MNEQSAKWLKMCISTCDEIYNFNDKDIKVCFTRIDKEYSKMSCIEKKDIIDFLYTEISDNIYIYIASVIMKCSCNADLKQILLNHFLDVNCDCLESAMIEYNIRACENMCIADYQMMRKLHTKNVELLKEEICVEKKYIPVSYRKINRVVIIADTFLSLYHAPTRVIMHWAYVLKTRLDFEVYICVCPLNKRMENAWYSALLMNSPSETHKCFNVTYENVDFDVYQFNADKNSLREYKSLLGFIELWKPLFVFEFGMINPIGDVLNNLTTTVAMNLSMHLPISEADYLITLENQPNEEKYISENQTVILRGRTQKYFEKNQQKYNRIDFELNDGDFVIAIVGNRLDGEVDNEFLMFLKKIQDKNKKVIYLVVGECILLKKKFKTYGIDKVVFLGYRKDLMGIYSMVNLYLNPKRNGGGYSGLMAINSEIPVVTLPDCDVAYNVGNDFIASNYDQMWEVTEKYINDIGFYNNQKLIAKKIADNNTKEKMYESICHEAKKIIKIVKDDICI